MGWGFIHPRPSAVPFPLDTPITHPTHPAHSYPQTVKSTLTVASAFKAVEEAFAMLAEGKVDVPQVGALWVTYVGLWVVGGHAWVGWGLGTGGVVSR